MSVCVYCAFMFICVYMNAVYIVRVYRQCTCIFTHMCVWILYALWGFIDSVLTNVHTGVYVCACIQCTYMHLYVDIVDTVYMHMYTHAFMSVHVYCVHICIHMLVCVDTMYIVRVYRHCTCICAHMCVCEWLAWYLSFVLWLHCSDIRKAWDPVTVLRVCSQEDKRFYLLVFNFVFLFFL